ncbi:MAG: hypothetical protein KF814_05495 [Nitrospiraceae bacterium]|nr:hypothetical protein [Nitrospiraceae bacterium]
MRIPPIVILGSGYTGRVIFELLGRRHIHVCATSREPDVKLPYVPVDRRLRFDLAVPSTWTAIPKEAGLIWTFPATPPEQVQAFAHTHCLPGRPLVVLGSTSAYDANSQPASGPIPWLDESAPIDHALPRVQGEEHLRTQYGAVILRVAGIYGPGRNPLDWIRRGRVGPSNKLVNLIHVEDLAEIAVRALERGKSGETYNVSDGQPRAWREICEEARTRWGVVPSEARDRRDPGKRISNRKLAGSLGYDLRHADLYRAIECIERPEKSQPRSPS